MRPRPLLAALLLALSGCSGPLVEWRDDPGETPAAPPARKVRAARPLFYWEREPAKPLSKAWFLWPLGSYRADEKERTFRLIPLYMRRVRNVEEGKDWDTVTLLLIFSGSDPKRGGYFAFFPIGGTFKNLLFKERIDFALFPLYGRVREGGNDSVNVLWPIFNRTKGPIQGWKVFPFYGRYRKRSEAGELLYDRRFWIWPFVTRHENGLETGRPTLLRFYFPFHGSIEGPSVSDRSWLFPFFKRKEEKGDAPRVDWKAPWPFVHVGNGKSYRRRDFWPFYGHLATGGSDRRYWIWPLFRKQRQVNDAGEHRAFFALPFYWRSSTRSPQGEVARSMRKVWPLYGRQRAKDGSGITEVLSPLWFNDRIGLTELFGPFWRLWAREIDPSGERRVSAGFGLYRSRRAGAGEPADWKLLGGLLGRETKDGKRRTRLLFLLW